MKPPESISDTNTQSASQHDIQLPNDFKNPPVAKKIETLLEKHGDKRIDNYYWLNDRENQEVIGYLNR